MTTLLERIADMAACVGGNVEEVLVEAANEIERLRAEVQTWKQQSESYWEKIKAMEQQKPVASVWRCDNGHIHGSCERTLPMGTKLYALPGAQPAPSIPEGWKPIPEKHPTFDLVDLRLADGSVLCECVPQSDGDYWWNGPSGEVFINPKYASVTHWRLAAAPEAKP